jgi:cell shape-determining protein MreC
MSVDNPDDLLRRMLPNFMRAHDEMVAELHFLRSRVEEQEDASDEIEVLKSENTSLRAELQRRIADKEMD